MNALQIESLAIDAIARLLSGKPNEDSRIEFKAKWPDLHQKAARQIAAHANAARGEPILWIIGVDQNAKDVIGVEQLEVSTWYEKIKSFFDDMHAPTLKDLNFAYDNKQVVALQFDTERFPFVVKYSNEILEVPWREGTRTRSASRFDLLKLLIPLQYLPNLEVLSGQVAIDQNPNGSIWWNYHIEMYIEPIGEKSLVIPYHKCETRISLQDSDYRFITPGTKLSPPYSGWFPNRGSQNLSQTIDKTPDEIFIIGPGRIILSGNHEIPEIPKYANDNQVLNIDLSVFPTGAQQPLHITIVLQKIKEVNDKTNPNTLYKWKVL